MTVKMRIKVTKVYPDYNIIKYILTNLIKSDSSGIVHMLPKMALSCFLIEGLTSYEANILKQESLSVGADLAISRKAILKNRKNEKTFLFATEKQLKKLMEKLKEQNLSGFKELIYAIDESYRPKIWRVRSKKIVLDKPILMGILNITPDSFSGDGLLSKEKALDRAEKLLLEGAQILDIGAESSRPGARRISEKQELDRLIPILKVVRKRFPKAIISIDTYKPSVAKLACEEGADIINDITGLRSPEMRAIVKKYKSGAVIMHMKANPRVMQICPVEKDVIAVVYEYLKRRVKNAVADGIDPDCIVVDPGIGFGKKWEDNYKLLAFVSVFSSIRPVLIGASLKSFIGFLTKAEVSERLPGTIAANLYAYSRGASIFRVHNVREHQQAFQVWEKLRENSL